MNNHLQPWAVSADDFPADSFTSDQLQFLLGYAILAPSIHNTQPWLFKVSSMDVEIFADRRRALRVVDPEGRELTISCGSALFNLRLAAQYFERHYQAEMLPDPADPDLLVRFQLKLKSETSSEEVLLFHAIQQRRSNRQAFRPDPVPEAVLEELVEAARNEGLWFQVLKADPDRAAVADLVAQADRRQWADRHFRQELALWVRTKPEAARDGIPVHDLGVKDWLSFAGPALIRTFDRGGGQAARDSDIALHSPVLAVLGTENDEPRSWIATGQALQSVLLHARLEEVWASFLNQPIEVPDLRAQLAALTGRNGFPQVLLRLGYGDPAPATPRRSVREVTFVHHSAHGK